MVDTWATIITIGVALGMDAFSLGIGLGAQGMRWRDVGRLTLLISFLHILLPLMGTLIGSFLYLRFGTLIQKGAAIVLMYLGAKMTLATLRQKGEAPSLPISANFLQLLLLALSVSLDSLSVGLTLGTFRVHPLIPSLFFGILGGSLSLLGLFLGKKANLWFGKFGQMAGGVVLALLGLKFLY